MLWKHYEKKIREARSQRISLSIDRTVVTGWNALMVSALVKTGVVSNQEKLVQQAIQTATMLWNNQRNSKGRLLRIKKREGERQCPWIFR